MSTNHLFLFATLVFMNACQTFPQKPEDQASWYLDVAIENYKNNPIQSCEHISNSIGLPTGSNKVKSLFYRIPEIKNDYVNCILRNIESAKTSYDFINKYNKGVMDIFFILKNNYIIEDNLLKILNEKLSKKVYRYVLNGELGLDLSADTNSFPLLATDKYSRMLLDVTLNKIQNNAEDREKQIFLLSKYVTTNSLNKELIERIKNILPSLHMNAEEAKAFGGIYMLTEAVKIPNNKPIKVKLEIKNGDIILMEDVLNIFETESSYIEWVTEGDAKYTVIIDQARYSENLMPDSVDTIVIDRNKVNLIDALISMPSHSSYSYDLVTKSFEIDYAYIVSVSDKNTEFNEKVVKGKINSSYVVCKNIKINNAFGGTMSADFIANSDMQRECSSNKRTLEDLKSDIYKKVLNSILAVPELHS